MIRRRVYKPPRPDAFAALSIVIDDQGGVRVSMAALHETDAARVEQAVARNPRAAKLVRDALRLAREAA